MQQTIPDDKLPESARIGRPPGCCNSKHPVAEFYCWLPAGHEDDYHTAGLNDWETETQIMKMQDLQKGTNP